MLPNSNIYDVFGNCISNQYEFQQFVTPSKNNNNFIQNEDDEFKSPQTYYEPSNEKENIKRIGQIDLVRDTRRRTALNDITPIKK